MLGIQNQFFDIENSKFYVFLQKKIDLEIDFLIEKSISGLKKNRKNLEKHGKIAKSAENANLPRIPVKTRGFLGLMLRATLLN